ncbi:MAG: Ppx/GppA family phosphatase [Acidimicrobiia bacterium]|nr:Ppx/GppA family phosphatase [Acidimicrobiia bacterium]
MRIAAVDIGTNTVRLLIARTESRDSETVVHWLDHREAVTRLGEGVDDDRVLSQDAMGRTLAVLAGYREAIRRHEASMVVAVATSATRDAANREDFLARAEQALGYAPTVISGGEEASLAFSGTTNAATGEPPHLVIDLGGGSTEFVLGKTEPDLAMSIDIGSVRLTERRLPHRPATPGQVAAARSEARRHLDTVVLTDEPGTILGVGGTFTTLAHLIGDGRVHGAQLSAGVLTDVVARLSRATVEETVSRWGVHPRRAPVLLGGAIVAEQALAHLDAGTITVSERDMLDGIVIEAARTVR